MQSSNDRPRIAAVVVTYNRCIMLEGCLNALTRQDRPPDEILVIDNASTDNTVSMLKQKFDGRITHVRLEENLGGSAGFCEGIRLAYGKGHDWIWIMDDDVEPLPDALRRLIECPVITDRSVGVLASMVLDIPPREGTPSFEDYNRVMAACPDGCGGWIPIGAGNYRLFTPTLGFRPAVTKETLKSPLVPIEGAGFLGVMIRREAVTAVGLPLKELFISWDDLEFTCRISQEFKLFLIPASRVIHRRGGDSRSPRKFLGLSKRGAGLPFEGIWRLYYSIRNEVYVRMKYAKPWFSPFVPAMVMTKSILAAFFFYDHPVSRCKIIFCAGVDGILGRLGKRISP
jgi:rhamnopyranosyl-N-acetylglucosaminyl-diphospho-decaprenol beta-1,3/1,4-galactofuranosyltransferase